ncbi:MAG: hypothetical protein E3J30_04715 [Anaerolineales bacterium]|nr:MAG: hypothetical protein E3J30_04715 [Anaerolineales bacterium]
MNVFDRVYEQLDALPKEERIQLLRQILPPQELFSRTDGTKFIIRKHGLRIFETSTLLTQAGIPEDDPRSEVFRELRGGLVDRKIPNALRAIAARSETVCRRNGAIQLWDGGRKAWWIPLAATSQFEEAINDLIQEFERMRDNLLLDDYESVRAEAGERWGESSAAAWENMQKLGKTTISREGFMHRSMVTFNQMFPSKEEIQEKIRMCLVPVQSPLPEKIEKILIDVREAERERLQAEADAAREQIRLIDLDRQLRQAELARIEQERQTRARILRDALNPEIEQAKEIIVQAQASLMRVACEIFRVIESGGEISPATMRSWNKRLEALSVLAIGNVSLEQALSDLKQLKEEIKGETFPDKRKLRAANKKVEKAFQDLERRAALEIHADQIWQLMRAGQGGEALERIAKLRQEATNSLNEVEALWKLVASVAAENEILSEEVDIADALVTQEVFE